MPIVDLLNRKTMPALTTQAGSASFLGPEVLFHFSCQGPRGQHRFAEFLLRNTEPLFPVSDLVGLIQVYAGLVAIVPLLGRIHTAHFSFSRGARFAIRALLKSWNRPAGRLDSASSLSTRLACLNILPPPSPRWGQAAQAKVQTNEGPSPGRAETP